MTETKTGVTPAPNVWPTLRARDARALIDFLVEGFGFEATIVYGDGDRVDHAELAWPEGGGVMVGSAPVHGPVPADGTASEPVTDWALEPGTFGAYVVTAHPDDVFARALARGATALFDPRDTDYGSRECAVRDPEGNLWSFGTYRGAPRST